MKYNKVFASFSSVFSYREAAKTMKRNDDGQWEDLDDFMDYLRCDTPFRPGTLVRARKGMFFPRLSKLQETMSLLTERFCEEKGLMKHSARLNEYLAGRVHSYTSTDKELLEMFYQFNDWCEKSPEADHPYGGS